VFPPKLFFQYFWWYSPAPIWRRSPDRPLTTWLYSEPVQAWVSPQYSGDRGPPRTYILTSTRLCPFTTPFLPPLFNSKSIILLTGSGVILGYYIQRWRHHFESGRAGNKFASVASEILWPPSCLKFTSVGPFTSMGPFMGPLPAWGPFAFMWPFTFIWAFHYQMWPFHPREAPPPGRGMVCVGSGSTVLLLWNRAQSTNTKNQATHKNWSHNAHNEKPIADTHFPTKHSSTLATWIWMA